MQNEFIKRLLKNEYAVAGFLFVFFFLSVLISRVSRLESSSSIKTQNEVHLYIENDTDLDGLIRQMNITGLLKFDTYTMKWASKLLGWRKFKTGHYLINRPYSFESFFSKIALGNQDPVSVTVLPGITPQRLARNLSLQLKTDSISILNQLEDSLFLAKQALSKEQLFGKMLPDTYELYWTISPKALVERLLLQFTNEVEVPYTQRAEDLGYSINDVLTMASIVEWEATKAEEKPVISGLYWNRLKRNMPLQADPTVNFALGERRRLLFEDYTVQHPFNTYTISGLPPGPITNPALSTIIATLYPEEHDYLYMVANPEGGHVFTKTFREHTIESEKWRRWLQEQYRIKRRLEAEAQKEAEVQPGK